MQSTITGQRNPDGDIQPDIVITILRGALAGKSYKFKAEFTVGRSDTNQLIMDAERDLQVSGSHAVLKREKRDWVYIDQGATNGSLVNGQPAPATTPILLRTGDQIELGEDGEDGTVCMQVRIEGQTVPTEPAPIHVESIKQAKPDSPSEGIIHRVKGIYKDYRKKKVIESELAETDKKLQTAQATAHRLCANLGAALWLDHRSDIGRLGQGFFEGQEDAYFELTVDAQQTGKEADAQNTGFKKWSSQWNARMAPIREKTTECEAALKQCKAEEAQAIASFRELIESRYNAVEESIVLSRTFMLDAIARPDCDDVPALIKDAGEKLKQAANALSQGSDELDSLNPALREAKTATSAAHTELQACRADREALDAEFAQAKQAHEKEAEELTDLQRKAKSALDAYLKEHESQFADLGERVAIGHGSMLPGDITKQADDAAQVIEQRDALATRKAELEQDLLDLG